MVATPLPRRPDGPGIGWRFAVCLVLAKAAWDAVGMLAGDLAYTAPSYDVLRSLPPAGGMRARGIILAAVIIATLAAARRAATTRRHHALRWCLAALTAWYMAWAVGLAGAWLLHGQILAWSAPASVLVVAALALRTAQTTPRNIGG